MINLILESIIQNTAEGWVLLVGGISIPVITIISVALRFFKMFKSRSVVQARDHKDILAIAELVHLSIKMDGANDEESKQKIEAHADEIMKGIEKRNLANPDLAILNRKTDILAKEVKEKRAKAIADVLAIVKGVTDEK